MAEHYLRIFSYAAVAHNDEKTNCIAYCIPKDAINKEGTEKICAF